MGNDLVHLTTASSQSEAGALRAYLDAHGVHVHVQGEHHSSLLGPLGSFAIELRLLVPQRDLDHARELLAAFYAAEPLDEDADVGELEPHSEYDSEPDSEDDDAGEELVSSRRPSVSPTRAAALAIIPGFGLGHFLTGATGRGFALMTLEALGIAWIVSGDLTRGLAAALFAVALDLFGATRRAHAQARPAMPEARLRSGDRTLR